MTGYQVVTDALAAHAATLARLAEETRAASDIGRQAEVTSDTYGRVGAGFAHGLITAARAGVDALTAAVAGLDAVGDKVRDTATSYDENEAAVGWRFR